MKADTTGDDLDPDADDGAAPSPDPEPIADGDVTPATDDLANDFREQVKEAGYTLVERETTGPRWFYHGDVVRDREDAAPNPAVVVAITSRIDEWDVDGEGGPTIAETNPGYDPSDRTVVVVYADDLARRRPDYTGGERLALSPLDDVLYAFPAGRLDRIGWGIDDPEEDEDEPGEETAAATRDRSSMAETADLDGLDLGAVADAIREEYGALTVEHEPGAPVVTVTTTLAEWTIDATGAVEGPENTVYDALDGVIADHADGFADFTSEETGGE